MWIIEVITKDANHLRDIVWNIIGERSYISAEANNTSVTNTQFCGIW